MKFTLIISLHFLIISALACEVKKESPQEVLKPTVVSEPVINTETARQGENNSEAVAPKNIEKAEKLVAKEMPRKEEVQKKVVSRQKEKETQTTSKEESITKPAKTSQEEEKTEPDPKVAELSFTPENPIPREHEQVVEEVGAKQQKKNISDSGSIDNTHPKTEEAPVVQQTWIHQDFDELLKKHVSNVGKVNYKGLRQELSTLDSYLTRLSETKISSLSKDEKLAFWINAYNAFTIKKIIDNYPLNSIMDLDGGKPWDVKWIELDGKKLSLNNIENDIIRPQFKEPRIHFAVNCAAKSCPPLMNKAWRSSSLEQDFTNQTKAFLSNAAYNKVSPSTATISKIFEWYAVDFGDLSSFLARYSSFKGSTSDLSYQEYDWSLNE